MPVLLVNVAERIVVPVTVLPGPDAGEPCEGTFRWATKPAQPRHRTRGVHRHQPAGERFETIDTSVPSAEL